MALPSVPASGAYRLDSVFACDEDVADRAGGDFTTLCADWNLLAGGSDGSFAPDDPWTLLSATVDFAAQGLAKGHVMILSKPTTVFHGQAQLFAVESSAPFAVTLRRLGQPPSLGQPPAPAEGLTAVEFRSLTMGPQIEEATYNLMQRFGLDINRPGRQPASVYDLRVLRRAAVLSVLYDRYASEARTPDGEFFQKYLAIKYDLNDTLSQCELRFGAAGDNRPGAAIWTARASR
jgi:hypothetical protein